MNNRNRGNNWERECVLLLKSIGFKNAVTCRNESRTLDSKKIDITKVSPLLPQCKNYKTLVDYPELIEQLKASGEQGIPVIFHKKTKKAKSRFVTQGTYAILELAEFLRLIKILKENNLLNI